MKNLPQILTYVGALLTLASIVLMHGLVSSIVSEQHHYEKKITQHEALISDLWQNANRMEHGGNNLIIMLNQNTSTAIINELISQQLPSFDAPIVSAQAIVDHVKTARSSVLARINSLYEEITILHDYQLANESKRNNYQNLALLFQALGLILLLNRNLAKTPSPI